MTSGSTFTQSATLEQAQLRDVVALSTLPSLWAGAEPLRVAESLSSSLLSMLPVTFVLVYFGRNQDRPPVGVAHTRRYQSDPKLAERIRSAATEWARDHDPDDLLFLTDEIYGPVVVSVQGVGVNGETGVIAAAFPQNRPPTPYHMLLLNIAANQAHTAVQTADLTRSLRRSEERASRVNEELSQRVQELQAANIEIQQARLAALNVMEEAVDAREVLGKQKAQYETLLNQAPMGVYVVDADFRIQDANPLAQRAFSIPDLVGSDFCEVVRDAWGIQYADEIIGIFRHTMATGIPYATPERHEKRRDRDATEYYEWRVDRIPLPDGRFGVVCYFRDISVQVLAREAIAESEQRFRTMANQAPVLIWITGPDKCYKWFNDPWLRFRGRLLDQEIGTLWGGGIHPDEAPHCNEVFEAAVEQKKEFTLEFRMRRSDGEWRWMLGHGLPLYEGKAYAGFIGSCIDVTGMKHAEDELRRANQALEQFAYSASHDLQEPLRSVKIYGQLLAMQYGKHLDAQALQFLEHMRAGAGRMELLVRDLLDYTQATQIDLPTQPVESGDALQAALKNLAGAIEESGATVTADPLPAVCIHEAHLQQIFQNLVGNAIKYRRAEESPRVHIAAGRKNEIWTFGVSDNGIGIDPKYKERIFGLFKRLHTNDQYSGTGIGLALCQRIVERYGGRIWVESEPGRGSLFQFTLPV